jgi:dihydrofolate reductase
MRKLVPHVIMTLDGVAQFDAVADRIGKLRDTEEVLADFVAKVGVHGSIRLVESLMQTDLLDERRLEVYPVVAGSGARLFQEGRPPKQLQLATSHTTSSGVVSVTYQPDRTTQSA